MWSGFVVRLRSFFIYKYFLLLLLYGFVLITPWSASVSIGFAHGEENKHQVCGAVQTSANKTVTLKQGITLSAEEFQLLRIQKLENATFLPNTENVCVIKMCGFTTTKKSINDPFTWMIRTGSEAEISSNIYNALYNVTAISCGCGIPSSLCNISCYDKIKFNLIPWEGMDCAVLYEETNCGHCWFPPISLKSGENYTTDNSHYIMKAVIRKNCTLAQIYSLKGQRPSMTFFDDTSRAATFVKEVFKSESGSTIRCKCPDDMEGIASFVPTSVNPSTTNSVITFITTPFNSKTTFPSPSSNVQNTTNSISSAISSTEHTRISVSAVQWAVFGGGLLILVVTALILTRKYWPTGRFTPSFENTVRSDSALSGNNPFGSEYDENAEYSRSMLNGPISLSISQVELQSYQHPNSAMSCDKSFSAGSESMAGLVALSPQETPEVPLSSTCTIPTQDDQLTAKIVDEVKKLMEGFLVTLGHSETLISSLEPSYSLTKSNSEMDSKLSLLTAQFHELCSPDHILPRDAFNISKRDLEKPLGIGRFGIVYLGSMKLETDGLAEKVAVKKINWPCSDDGIVELFLREVKIFESIGTRCENTVTFLGASCLKDGLFIVTEFCEGGSLRSYLVDKLRSKIFTGPKTIRERTTSIGEGYVVTLCDQMEMDSATQNDPLLTAAFLHQFLIWCEDIAYAMEYLSLQRIIHVDLAARNILLTSDLHVKICDFGLSRKCQNRKDYCSQSLLTDNFPFNSFVPEWNTENVREPKQASLYVDIWAYGCTLWELFTVGDQLYPDVKENGPLRFWAITQLLKEGYRHPKPPLAPDYVWEKLKECWNEEPRSRPNFTHLHRYFRLKRTKVEGC